MRALWFLFLPLLLLAQSPTPPREGIPINNAVPGANGAKNGTPKESQRATQSPPLPAASPAQGSTNVAQQTAQPSPAAKPREIAPDPIIRYTFWLVVVGALQFVALIVQAFFLWKAFRETTTATELTAQALAEAQRSNAANEALTLESNTNARISAEASKQSADALVQSDRAWLVIRPYKFQLVTSNRFDWVVTNVGRSTAKILETSVRCRTDISYQRQLPPTPQHNPPIMVHGVPIAPGETLNFWSGYEALDPTYNAVMNTQLTAQNIPDILANKVDLVAYGYVKYEDAFGKPHESRFCFYFATYVNDFRINLNAPAEYHQCN